MNVIIATAKARTYRAAMSDNEAYAELRHPRAGRRCGAVLYRASWKMTPRAVRVPERTVDTP